MLNQVLATLNLSGKLEITELPSLSFNACYKLSDKALQKHFFLKLLLPERTLDARVQEIEVAKLASDAKLAPLLIQAGHETDYSWMLLDYIPHLRQASLAEMASCLRAFHQLPYATRIKRVDPLDLAHHYLLEAMMLAPNSVLLQKLKLALQGLALPPIQDLCLCHLDVHPGNFLLRANTALIIDFENAGVFDPLYDLAVLGFYLAFDDADFKALLSLYMPFNEAAFARILHYQNICLHLFLCFLAYRLLSQGIELPTPVTTEQGQFSSLIQTYWQRKDTETQKKLDFELFRFGLGLLEMN